LDVRAVKGEFVGPVDLHVGAGEVVGLTGLTDGGHYQLGEMLFGLQPIRAGQVDLHGKPFRPEGPSQAMKRDVAYVPPDRNAAGLALSMPVSENLFLNPADDNEIYGPFRFIHPSRELGSARTLLERYRVRPPQPALTLSALSGGNAQKVLFARWQ